MLNLFNRRGSEFPIGQNFVCVIDESTELVEMLPVEVATASQVHTSERIFSRQSATVRFLPDGGQIFFYNCNLKYLTRTEELKDLEESIVLKNITSFDRAKSLWDDMKFYVIVLVLVIVIFALRK